MVDWPLFLLGLVATSIVATAVRAIIREDEVARADLETHREPIVVEK